ncbi:MAG: ribonuclease HI [Deltaproteobacteria bacterium]|nr:ribonuclease HI [Deltaproteobacteria bacterium]
MPWVRGKVRGTSVYARVDETGRLATVGGRVEIRYQPRDGRLYRAVAANVVIVDATVLPDDTCAPAEEAARDGAKRQVRGGASSGPRATAARAAAAAPPPTEPPPSSALAYSDGACSGNPGPAGLGVVVVTEGERIEVSEFLGQATNNVAELTAVLRALEAIDPKTPAVIYTDSRYAIGVVQQGWKAKANTELVAELRRRLVGREVELRYVPGHAGVELNERADALARLAISRRASERRVAPRPVAGRSAAPT